MTFFSRLLGVYFNPKDTFTALSERPKWADILIVLLILVTVYAALIAPYIPQDQIKRLQTDTEAREKRGEDAYQRRMEFWKNPPPIMAIAGIIMQPVSLLIGFLIQPLIILGIGRLTSTEGKYIQIFSTFIHANAINLVLGNSLRAFLISSRESVFQTTTSLALFFPRLETMSPAYVVLTQVDFFQLWVFGILGFALADIFKIELKKGLILSYSFWLIRSLFYIAIGLLSMKLGG
ncbi:MAG: YIP1 family protein [Candidatus Aminicenantes bacterium]|nr:MAG: YIP1 family protein [Candidatus Aminicenantes bacterium]